MTKVELDELLDVTAFVDPAGGHAGRAALKFTASRSADVVVGQDSVGHIFVLHAWAGRISTDAHTDRIFRLVEDWHPRVVGIDASAMQTLYADAISREAKQRRLRLPLLPQKMPGQIDKDNRIRTVLQPVVNKGRLFIRPEQRELQQELEAFPLGATKDLVDALASAIALLKKVVPKDVSTMELDARVAYLKESGAPNFYVQAVRDGAA